ncbi:retron St85 family effector protein [Aeromonas schubertii]|uniref:retron St85 family effector protein n=1 Tax=Aeromonas schubertii TaxID=652 RepID=UPI0038B6AC4B
MKNKVKNEDLDVIADFIRNNIFFPQYEKKNTIFLCGADINDSSKFRAKLAASLTKKTKYELLFPEDIFDDLLAENGKYSLLELENILAKNVDAIIIIPESPGSLAELGAFSNNKELAKKTIVISNKKYEKKKSFINYGPYRLIRKSGSGKVIHVNYDDFHDVNESEKIIRNISGHVRDIKSKNPIDRGAANILEAERFILPCIYLLDYVDFSMLLHLLMFATKESKELCEIAIKSALGRLTKSSRISKLGTDYKVTNAGVKFVMDKFPLQLLDNARIEIINVENRRHASLRYGMLRSSARP